MRRKILALSVVMAVILAGYAAYLFKTHHQDEASTAQNIEDGEGGIGHKRFISQDYSEIINMAKWRYNQEDDVYYQLGILYAQRPADEKYERLALFVPSAFMNCRANGPETYSCEPNEDGRIGKYGVKTAPIVIPVESPEYAANPALTEYKNFSLYTKAGMVYAHVGFRGLEHGAPAGLVDLKAAIRYIRHNQPQIPAQTDRIFVFGTGRGGGLGALLGTTADSAMFRPYIKDIGAPEYASDKVYGVMAWCPITDFDAADEAYEWNMGMTRAGLSPKQQELSQRMAQEYVRYVNNAGFRDEHGQPLILQYSKHGVYQEGSYYDYVKSVIEKSLNEFLQTSTYPLQIAEDEVPPHLKRFSGYFSDKEKYLRRLNEDLNWVRYDGVAGSYTIRSIEDFVRIFKPATKPIGAFDSLARTQTENILFGLGNNQGYHFDKYMVKILKDGALSAEYASDLKKHDALGYSVQDRLNMYTPLYFTMPMYEGYRTAKVAPFWRIRSGISQTETSLTTEINLALALINYPMVEKVDFKTIWAKGHSRAEEKNRDSEQAFIKWIDEVTEVVYKFSTDN